MEKTGTEKIKYTDEYMMQVYDEKVRERLDDIRRMFFEGYSFGDVAKELGVPNSLLWKMRRNKKTQYADLRAAFEFSDLQIKNVETALYRKAIGFYYDEDEKVATVKEYYNKKGEKCKEPVVKTVRVRKYCPPDVSAIKFFLTNKAAASYSEGGRPTDSEHDKFVEGMSNVLCAIKKFADGQGEDL